MLARMTQANSSYIFYGDESGDHSLTSIDDNFPVFALSLCAFKKSTYCRKIVPRFQELKFQYFGHDAVVFHEHEIRKQIGHFKILINLDVRQKFMSDLTECISRSQFKILHTVILKSNLKADLFAENPYSISLQICLQKAFIFLSKCNEADKISYFIFEKRGPKEDRELELEFRRIVSGENFLRAPFPNFRIHFSDKKSNSTGMQIADLTARPIALKIYKPGQLNRTHDIILRKIARNSKLGHPRRGIYA